MEGFNNFMDDMKDALVLSSEKKSLYLPALLANVIIFILGIVAVIGLVAFIITSVAGSFALDSPNMGLGRVISIIIVPIILGLVFALLFGILFIIFDIGITGMVIGTVDGEKPSAALFFDAVKEHFFSVFFTKIGFGLLILVSAILWIIPWLLYTVTVGLLSGGWGMIFLICAIQTLVGFWVLIKVEDQRGGFESIGVNISFGRKHFWLLVLIFFVQMRLASFLPTLLGLIGAALASLFISYAVNIFFKIVLLKTYRRYREERSDYSY